MGWAGSVGGGGGVWVTEQGVVYDEVKVPVYRKHTIGVVGTYTRDTYGSDVTFKYYYYYY